MRLSTNPSERNPSNHDNPTDPTPTRTTMTWLTALSIGLAADTLIALWLTAATHQPEWLKP